MSEYQIFSDTDRVLQTISEEITAVKHLRSIYKKQHEEGIEPRYWKTPKGMRPTVGHIMLLGPAGCGKTRSANKIADMMNLKEGKNFHRVSADAFPNIQDFINFLLENLTWHGYLCDNGQVFHTEHTGCVRNGRRCCKIVDPVNPRGPVPPVIIFFDEIHMMPKKIQDKIGVILLESYYSLHTDRGVKTIYFPRFTMIGATTDVGMLSPALQSRFKVQVPVSYYHDSEMEEIVQKMLETKNSMSVNKEAVEILAKCAQGVPRNAENHIDRLMSHWISGVKHKGWNPDDLIDGEKITAFYDNLKYIPEGYTFNQIELLKYLATGNIDKKGNRVGLGITKICHRFGIDKLNFLHNWEPVLQRKGLICTGTRGREITPKGLEFLQKLSEKYPGCDWDVH